MNSKNLTSYIFTTILMIFVNTSNCYSQAYEDFLTMLDEEDGPILTQENKVQLGFPAEYKVVFLKKKKRPKAKQMRGNVELIPGKKVRYIYCYSDYDRRDCKDITAIKIENDLINVDFSDCTNLEFADLYKFRGRFGARGWYTTYTNKTFKNCENLKRVFLPKTIQVIGEETFYGCKNLKMYIPMGIRSIEKNAFKYCMNMPKTQYFGETVTLQDYVFAKTNIKRLIFNNLISSQNSFAEMDSLEELSNNSGKYISLKNLKSLKKIDLSAKEIYTDSCPNLEEVFIKESKHINGFNNCPNLRIVHIKGNDIYIDGFYNCPNLEEVYIDGVYKLSGFNNCPKLKTIKLGISGSGEINGFSNCDSLLSAKIKIESKDGYGKLSGFENCKNLTNVIFEQELPYSLSVYAFNHSPKFNKSSLMNNYVTDTEHRIYRGGQLIDAFYYKKIWGDTVHEYAFNGIIYQDCGYDAQLKGTTSDFNYYYPDGNVEIPSSIDIFGQKVYIVSMYKGVFKGNNHIVSVNLPNTITGTWSEGFADCKSLRKVKLPENSKYTKIQNDFFRGCTSLEEIYIPSNITHIYSRAFAGCKNLRSIKSNNIHSIEISDNAFRDCYSLYDIQLNTKTRQAIETSICYDEAAERRDNYEYVERLGNQIEGIIETMREEYIYGGLTSNKKYTNLQLCLQFNDKRVKFCRDVLKDEALARKCESYRSRIISAFDSF